jgi:hypothetical protein
MMGLMHGNAAAGLDVSASRTLFLLLFFCTFCVSLAAVQALGWPLVQAGHDVSAPAPSFLLQQTFYVSLAAVQAPGWPLVQAVCGVSAAARLCFYIRFVFSSCCCSGARLAAGRGSTSRGRQFIRQFVSRVSLRQSVSIH